MIIIKTVLVLQKHIKTLQKNKATIGFVPTMGALHNGHISLIQKSIKTCTITVCSIFINPTQFNDKKDFEKYPTTIEQDILMLELAKCDVLFLPSVNEMYPNGIELKKEYPLGFVSTVFEGTSRVGHFNGVCQVVERLLQIVTPHYLFLGQKDYQQCIVIKKLIELMHKQDEIKVVICPTSREANGLAMSSRNQRLTSIAKDKATIIYQSFNKIKKEITAANSVELLENSKATILQNGFSAINYLSLANAHTLQPIAQWNGTTPLVILFAGLIDGVRLIDNMVL
jgi:pantoate--beta-alanine ligase